MHAGKWYEDGMALTDEVEDEVGSNLCLEIGMRDQGLARTAPRCQPMVPAYCWQLTLNP